MAECIVSYMEIAELIGEAQALALSQKRGGRTLYIPSVARLGEASPVVILVGMDNARALAARFGGGPIMIPIGPGKRARIWELRRLGRPVSAIAAEMHCTERTVYNVFAGAAPDLPPSSQEELPPLLAFLARKPQ